MTYRIAALYRFTPVSSPADLRAALLPLFQEWGITGTLLVAPEGINGTLAGSDSAIDKLVALLGERCGLQPSDVKFSAADRQPFQRLKIRLKKEIITFKQPAADPNIQVGAYVEPQDWNALIADPDVVVLDTRNKYETMIGTFEGAQDPQIDQFTDFAAFVRETLDPTKHKKVAMFCTGGIRCEKASAFMLAEGFDEVYHLKGGILKYLEQVPAEQSRWNGECYVFDRRVSVGHGLTTGKHDMCFSCGLPLTTEDKAHPHYEAGVSCSHCHASTSAEDKARFRMRQAQLQGQPA